ncbi:MAG: hypothetical protein SPJ34_04140 [Candidatus Ornithospirochaeta sp.]|nr:hypothetical protein [Candidatus Ornithospirochaeta sp.]
MSGTAEETQDVYGITLNGWMTIGEDEYVMKDCRLRIEGSVPVSSHMIWLPAGLRITGIQRIKAIAAHWCPSVFCNSSLFLLSL